jgi:hypothetical protein
MSGLEFEGTCHLSQRQLIEEFFMEHRTKILDLAAFLDRLDRSVEKDGRNDFRFLAFRQALEELGSGAFGRAKRVQMILSDPVPELLEERDRQAAFGASSRGEGRRA